LAKKKKKKKKRSGGGAKPSYAKGKKVESSQDKAAPAAKQPAQAAKKGSGREEQRQEAQQWNLVRRGTLEAKVMLALLGLIAFVALLSYPVTAEGMNAQYEAAKKEYPKALAQWTKDNPTKAQQEKNAKTKPAKPSKPTGGMIWMSVAFTALQSAVFAFLGLNILRRTDLRTPALDKTLSGGGVDWPDIKPFLTWSVPFGLALLVPLYASARISSNLMDSLIKRNGTATVNYTKWKQLLGFLNFGVFFWVLFAFVAVVAFIWLFTRYREHTRVEPHYAGIAAAALLAAGYWWLDVSQTVGSSAADVSSAMQVLYAVGLAATVLLLGYVFWKKGLEYSLLAALIGFGLYPIMVSIVIK
jgi:hypothetical protein